MLGPPMARLSLPLTDSIAVAHRFSFEMPGNPAAEEFAIGIGLVRMSGALLISTRTGQCAGACV